MGSSLTKFPSQDQRSLSPKASQVDAGVYVPLTTYYAVTETLEALNQVQLLVTQVDERALNCTLTDLPARLKGMDEALSAAMTKLIGAQRKLNLGETRNLSLFRKHIAARIDAIQVVEKDGGDRLRTVIAASKMELAEFSQEIRQKARQGQQTQPETIRLREYTQKHYSPSVGWHSATQTILHELRNYQADEVDHNLLDELEFRLQTYGEGGLKTYVKNKHHEGKREKRRGH